MTKQKKQMTAAASTLRKFWEKLWLPTALLIVAAIAVYLPTVRYEYVVDDKIVLTENSYVKEGWAGIGKILTTESMSGFFGEQKDLLVGARYRPLSIITFAMEYAAWGANPVASHLINTLLYGLLALVLYRLLVIILPSENKPWYLTLPFAAAALYVLHPIHSEAVANVKGRDEIMAALGAFAAMWYNFRYVQTKRLYFNVISGVFFWLALLSKESALPVLALFPVTAYFFAKSNWRVTFSTLLFPALATLIYFFMRYQAIGYLLTSEATEQADVMNNPFYGVSAAERFATIFYTLGLYLKLLFFPHPLTHDYYPYQVPILTFADWRVLVSVAAYAALAVLAVRGWRARSIPAYGIIFYLVTLSIVSNLIVPVGTFMNERFVFIPSLGFCLGLGWLISAKVPLLPISDGFKPWAIIGVLALILSGYTFKLLQRLPDWQNEYTLNLAAVAYSPNSARANLFMGVAIYNREYNDQLSRNKKERLLQEILYFVKKAWTILPTYQTALDFEAGLWGELYATDNNIMRLLQEYDRIVRFYPESPQLNAYLDWAISRSNSKDLMRISGFCYDIGYDYFASQKSDYPNALRYLKLAEKAAPYERRIWSALKEVYFRLGDRQNATFYLDKIARE